MSAKTHRPGQPSNLARFFWIVCGVFAVFTLAGASAVAYAAYAIATLPAIEVSIDDHTGDGPDLSFSVPAALVGAGLKLAPYLVPDEAWEEARSEIEGELAELTPETRAAAAELIRQLRVMPDALIVEVDDHGEHVEVAKRGDSLVVSVRSHDADVDVTVPVVLFEMVAELVEL